MGLFSSSYQTSVSTSVSRVIADKDIPSAIKTGTFAAIFSKGDITDHILDSTLSGVGMKAERMYDYAKRSYTYGVPSSLLASSANDKGVATAVIKSIKGVDTTVLYCHYGPLNLLHLGWSALVSTHGYSAQTNILGNLSTEKGVSVYLKDVVVVVTNATLEEKEDGSLGQWGIAASAGYTPERIGMDSGVARFVKPTAYEVDPAALQDYIRVSYVWVTAGTPSVIHEGFFTVPVTGDSVADYAMVQYVHAGVVGYWTYKFGSGTHPQLDALTGLEPSNLGSFFPFAYFRFNKTSMASAPTSQAYLTSKKMVKYLGMDYASVIESVHQNPGIGQVEQAMVMMAVPAHSTNPVEVRYLFDFFRQVALNVQALAVQQGATFVRSPDSSFSGMITSIVNWSKNDTGGVLTALTMVIQDKRFKMAVNMAGITKKFRPGVIGAVGSYTNTHGSYVFEQVVNEAGTLVSLNADRAFTAQYYRHQVSENIYEEVAVLNLNTRFYISGGYTTLGDGGSPIFLIPLDYSITQTYPSRGREALYSRSLHFVFNSLTVTETKWYQSGIFSTFLTIVGLVISFYNLPAGLAVMTAAAAAQMVLMQLLIYLIKRAIVILVFKLFVKIVGVEIAILSAIVATAAGVTIAIENGGLAGAPWAGGLLELASNINSGVGESLKESMQGLKDESERLREYIEGKTKLIESANELLDTSSKLSPFIIMGQTPAEFINMTMYSGDTGQTSIDAVYSYVDIALTLPKLNDTVGVHTNGNQNPFA